MERPTVYSKENCVQCTATYRKLDASGIEYDIKMLDEEPEKLQEFKNDGLLQAPVVEAFGDRWSGFRPDKIGELALRNVNRSE